VSGAWGSRLVGVCDGGGPGHGAEQGRGANGMDAMRVWR
jgi:hypothetical protein